MSRPQARKRDRAFCPEAGTKRFGCQAVYARRHVDRHNPAASLGKRSCCALQRPRQATPKQSIQNDVMRRLKRLLQWLDIALPKRRGFCGISH